MECLAQPSLKRILCFMLDYDYPIPTEICLSASSLLPVTPENRIIAESGMAPNRGSTTPPMMAAGRPRSRRSSAPSKVERVLLNYTRENYQIACQSSKKIGNYLQLYHKSLLRTIGTIK